MTGRPEGRSLELYFIDGRPDGMLTAEVFNWTGHILMAPRTQITAALSRKESRHTGVYLLMGERDGQPVAYLGEGDDISHRIKNHDINKDWWTTVVLVTSAANNLHKAHVQYLEARLIEVAKTVGRVVLDNATAPGRPTLGVLVPQGDHAVFSQAYAFKSTSAAAAVVNGRPANGTVEWRVVGSGQTYKAWEAAQLGASS